jgi:hypothetical protein
MMRKAVFEGLVVDENDRPVEVVYIGEDPCYVVDDDGFRRHIPAEQVDRQVFDEMKSLMEGHEDIISEQAAKMLGQDDIFSMAMIAKQLRQIDEQLENLSQIGIPEEARAYMGMMGFKIIIDVHGEVVDVQQAGMIAPDDEE